MSDNKSVIQDSSGAMPESEGLYRDACTIIEQAQATAYRSINEILIKRNWLLGMRIQREVLKDERAKYGEQVVKNLSVALVNKYNKGFQLANLYHFIAFYNCFPNIFYAVSGKSGDESDNIFYAMSRKSNDDADNILHAASGKSEIVPSLTGQKVSVFEFFRLQNG